MSGGGKKTFCGRMGAKVVQAEVTPAQVERAEADLAQVGARCTELKRRHQQLEEAMDATQKRLDKMLMDQRKHTMDAKVGPARHGNRVSVSGTDGEYGTVTSRLWALNGVSLEQESDQSVPYSVKSLINTLSRLTFGVSSAVVEAPQKVCFQFATS